jgi:hypothetical protein
LSMSIGTFSYIFRARFKLLVIHHKGYQLYSTCLKL